jgi:hypothetical protein
LPLLAGMGLVAHSAAKTASQAQPLRVVAGGGQELTGVFGSDAEQSGRAGSGLG